MKIEQKKFSQPKGWETLRNDSFNSSDCDLVIIFGSKDLLKDDSLYDRIRSDYPVANIIMNSTSGEIIDVQVNDETISLTAIKFNKTQIKTASVNIASYANSFEAGRALTQQFSDSDDMKNILVISDGQLVNGSELVNGLQSSISKDIIITGGLAGDGSNFKSTLVGLNQTPTEGMIIAVAFYGSLVITYGSVGGWDSFGPERLITKSKANVLFELDGKPALDIYKNYLGERAKDLPGSGLLFPLSIRNGTPYSLVRTILAVNEDEHSVTFAGNMPEGNYARLMKANFDRLIEGSSSAATNSLNGHKPELAILISCVGRKLVLDQRIEEEVEVVRAVYGDKTAITGFYSYGEIAPSFSFAKCELHNQTMTITTFTEE
ncbi:MAG: FIST C-terminal domain-containing protein [Bacteroidota bacterium]|nr:FIST C-terminal domain-containing protein [Bacteroidota bacterium]